MRFFLFVVLTMFPSCSTIENDRVCLDWKSRAVEEKIQTWCDLYEDLEPPKQED